MIHNYTWSGIKENNQQQLMSHLGHIKICQAENPACLTISCILGEKKNRSEWNSSAMTPLTPTLLGFKVEY